MIPVTEQSTGLIYRSYAAVPAGGLNNTKVPNYTYRVATSYVTGAHTFKTGWNDTFGYLEAYNYAYQPIMYTFLNGTPTQPDPVGGPVHGAQRGKPRLRRVRAGQLENGEDDRHRRHPVRLVQDRIPRADHRPWPRAGRTPESQHQLPGERQPQLERPHVPIGHGVRPARRRQDGDQGRGKQVPARADAQRLRSVPQPRQRAPDEHDPHLGRLEPQLRRRLQPGERSGAEPHRERRRQLRRRSRTTRSGRPSRARRSIRTC